MFKWRVVSCSNVNGKIHSFQKDFDDYDSYQEFIDKNPEYSSRMLTWNLWNPWRVLDWSQKVLGLENLMTPVDTKYLPAGIDLEKYETRRLEKRQTEAEKWEKKRSLERSKEYLEDYIAENPKDAEAKSDIEKIMKELKALA